MFASVGSQPSMQVSNALRRAGYRSTRGDDWSVMWGRHLKNEEYRHIRSFQRINHFPASSELGRKDTLIRNLARAARRHGAEAFSFFPRAYTLPEQRREFSADFERTQGAWIIKPVAGARGAGIRVVRRASEVPHRRPLVIQKYINNPYLIGGKKFDIRLYVLVTSFDPLCIYLFEEGLVRFATQKYSKSAKHSGNRMIHLTNYSLQKHSKDFVQPDAETEDQSTSKWSVTSLRQWFASEGIDDAPFWQRVHDLIVKTCISVEGPINAATHLYCKYPNSCFELFGFDILPDRHLNPWLLEVNVSPSLHSQSSLDARIKSHLATSVFALVGLPLPNLRAVRAEEMAASRIRLMMGGERQVQDDVSKAKRQYCLAHEANTLLGLNPDDCTILRSFEEQVAHKGPFALLFPTPLRGRSEYGRFFTSRRYANILLWDWVALSGERRGRALGRLRAGTLSDSRTGLPWSPQPVAWRPPSRGEALDVPRSVSEQRIRSSLRVRPSKEKEVVEASPRRLIRTLSAPAHRPPPPSPRTAPWLERTVLAPRTFMFDDAALKRRC